MRRRRAGRARSIPTPKAARWATLLAAALGLAILLVWPILRADQPADLGSSDFPELDRSRASVVWAVGDGPDGGAHARDVAELIAGDDETDRVLYLGDTYAHPEGETPVLTGAAGPGGESEDNWHKRFAGAFGSLASITAPTPGNHDWPGDAEEGYLPYWEEVTGRRIPAWYSFRLGGWQLLSLNSEAPHDADSPQVRWAMKEMEGAGTCRIAYWHRPRFSAGDHGDQPDTDPLWQAVRGRAAIVIAGHDHNMQRLRSIDGTTLFVSGAGGHSHYDLDDDDDRLAFANDTDYGALRLELEHGRGEWRFVTVDGAVVDSGELSCDPGDAVISASR